MPFRIPDDYEKFAVGDEDPTIEELQAYVVWLETELTVARHALIIRRQVEDKNG